MDIQAYITDTQIYIQTNTKYGYVYVTQEFNKRKIHSILECFGMTKRRNGTIKIKEIARW